MAFKIKLLLSAQNDLEEALDYYYKISPSLSSKFYSKFVELNSRLEENPFFERRYENIRTYRLKNFPYMIHFVIDETSKTGTIIAVVFGKREKANFTERLNKPGYDQE